MKTKYAGLTAIPLVLALVGCTTTEQGTGMGALLGAGIGQLAGGDTQSTMIGTAAGALIGTMAGAAVEGEQEQYAAREKELNQKIGTLETRIAKTHRINSDLKKKVSGLRQQIAFLDSKRNRSQAETARLKRLVASAQSQQQTAQRQLAEVETELRNAQNVAARHSGSPQAQELQKKIAALEKERSELRQSITQLASTTASVTL